MHKIMGKPKRKDREKLELTVMQILKKYDLGKEIIAVEQLLGGNIGSNYYIKSSRGDFVLRIRDSGFTPQQVASDHDFLLFLREHGFPSPGIVSQKDGTTFGIDENKRTYELQEFIPHEKTAAEKSYSEISSGLAGFLGQYQVLSRDFPREIKKMDYLGEIPLGFWEKYFRGPLAKGQSRYLHSAQNIGGETGRELEEKTTFLADELEKIKQKVGGFYQDLPRIVNHNDFYGNNILFRGEEIVGLVDFDFCSTDIFYIDLIELLHGSVIWWDGEEKFWGLHPEGVIRREQGLRDLEIYLEQGPGLEISEEVIADLLKTKVISLIFYPAFDLASGAEQRLEITRRVEKTLSELDKF